MYIKTAYQMPQWAKTRLSLRFLLWTLINITGSRKQYTYFSNCISYHRAMICQQPVVWILQQINEWTVNRKLLHPCSPHTYECLSTPVQSPLNIVTTPRVPATNQITTPTHGKRETGVTWFLQMKNNGFTSCKSFSFNQKRSYQFHVNPSIH